nr:hypothetical protein HmN_000915800 [Hymenolepis microstoma]
MELEGNVNVVTEEHNTTPIILLKRIIFVNFRTSREYLKNGLDSKVSGKLLALLSAEQRLFGLRITTPVVSRVVPPFLALLTDVSGGAIARPSTLGLLVTGSPILAVFVISFYVIIRAQKHATVTIYVVTVTHHCPQGIIVYALDYLVVAKIVYKLYLALGVVVRKTTKDVGHDDSPHV